MHLPIYRRHELYLDLLWFVVCLDIRVICLFSLFTIFQNVGSQPGIRRHRLDAANFQLLQFVTYTKNHSIGISEYQNRISDFDIQNPFLTFKLGNYGCPPYMYLQEQRRSDKN